MSDQQNPNFTYGCKKDTLDENDYILVEALTKVSQELTILKQQELQFGLWNPKRARNGEPKNSQIDLRPVDPKIISQIGDENIIIPLRPSISLKAQIDNDLEVKLPKEYYLYKGYFDKALSFDALKQNYLRIRFNCQSSDTEEDNSDTTTEKENPQDFTVELWLKVASLQKNIHAETQTISIIETWSGKDKGYPFAIRYLHSSGRVICSRYNPNTLPSYQESQVISRSTINDGEFHHIAFVKEGDNLYLYIDGEEDDNAKDTTALSNINISDLYIGSQQGKSNFFTGCLNEIRIWKNARTDEQITDNFKSSLFRRKQQLQEQDTLSQVQNKLLCYLYFDQLKNQDQENQEALYYLYSQDGETQTNHSFLGNLEPIPIDNKNQSSIFQGQFQISDFDNWSEVKHQGDYSTCRRK